ncbi:MAG: YggU family protein [Bdellovibrionaceae bacterium]|nr:YggU family protein [Pseudobdellovibrionaceae bacterium]
MENEPTNLRVALKTDPSGAVLIAVHAQPGARRCSLVGLHGDALKIKIGAPPVEGKANEELTHFLAELLEVSKRSITLIKGDKSRAKVFRAEGLSLDTALAKLAASMMR